MSPPRVGSTGLYYHLNADGERSPDPAGTFKVVRVEGNVCHCRYDGKEGPDTFIWLFKDGPNRLHFWPGRDANERPTRKSRYMGP